MSTGRDARKRRKEGSSAESTLKPLDRIDAVLATFNEVLGLDAYRTGARRSKATAEKIGARMEEERLALDGDLDRAERRCCDVVRAHNALWRNDQKMAPFIRPDTLFRPEKWADRIAAAGQWRAKRSGANGNGAHHPDKAEWAAWYASTEACAVCVRRSAELGFTTRCDNHINTKPANSHMTREEAMAP